MIDYQYCPKINCQSLCHYRYLALMAGLASEADWVFIPEWPPQKGWEDILCKKLSAVSIFSLHCIEHNILVKNAFYYFIFRNKNVFYGLLFFKYVFIYVQLKTFSLTFEQKND